MRSTRNGLLALSAAGAIVLSCATTSPAATSSAATTPAATASAVHITKQPVAVGTGVRSPLTMWRPPRPG